MRQGSPPAPFTPAEATGGLTSASPPPAKIRPPPPSCRVRTGISAGGAWLPRAGTSADVNPDYPVRTRTDALRASRGGGSAPWPYLAAGARRSPP